MSYPPPGGTPDPYGQGGTPDPYGQQPSYQDPYAAPGSPASGAPYGQPQSGAPYGQQPQSGAPYSGQPYSQPYPQYGAPAAPGTNIMAILSLVFAFVVAPVGIVLGHIAKKQIKQTGEQGDGLATAGLVLSYIFTGLAVLGCCAALAIPLIAGSTTSY